MMRILRRTLLTGWSLGLLSGAAVVGNAVFLQTGKHPAPLFATRGGSATTDEAVDRTLVTEIQRELSARGLYRGPLDGILGPETRRAIQTFEAEREMPMRGAATEAFLATLATSSHAVLAKTAQEPDVQEAEAEPDPRLAEVQAALSRAAYGPVNADGVFGPRTRDAIMRFQLDEGLPVTGKVDDALVDRLKTVGALGA